MTQDQRSRGTNFDIDVIESNQRKVCKFHQSGILIVVAWNPLQWDTLLSVHAGRDLQHWIESQMPILSHMKSGVFKAVSREGCDDDDDYDD